MVTTTTKGHEIELKRRLFILSLGLKPGHLRARLGVPSSLRRVLGNAIYSSQRPYCPEALVDEATFTQAQALLQHRPHTPRIPHASTYLLAGLVRCPCGSNMTGHMVRKRKDGPLYRYYRCTRHAQVGSAACPGFAVHAQPLEDVVVESLFDLSLHPERLRTLLATEIATRRKTVQPLQKEVQRLRRALAAVEQRDTRIKDGFARGFYEIEDAMAQKAQAATERDALTSTYTEAQEQLAHAEADSTDCDRVISALQHLWDVYSHLPFDGKRELLRAVIDVVALEEPRAGHLDCPTPGRPCHERAGGQTSFCSRGERVVIGVHNPPTTKDSRRPARPS